MSSEKTTDKSRKRKYKHNEGAELAGKEDEELNPKGAKKSKTREIISRPGYFVMARESNSGVEGGEEEEGGEGRVKLLAEDKQEISDLLDQIEERKRKKREKRALRKRKPAEEKKVVEPVAQQSLEYLKQWHEDKLNWKFKSARESWLIRNWRDLKAIPDDSFKLLVPYLESMKGARRDLLRKEAKAFTKKFKKEHDNYKTARDGSDSYAVQYRRAMALRKALRSEDD